MAATELELRWSALAIAALPIGVFVLTDGLLDLYGGANPAIEAEFAKRFDSHAEAAGRLHVLAAFILFVAGATACCGFFVKTLMALPSQARRRLLVTNVAAIVAGLIVLAGMNTRETQSYVGPGAVCRALSPAPSDGRVPAPVTAEPRSDPITGFFNRLLERGPNVGNAVDEGGAEICDSPRFRMLRTLLTLERNLLVLAIAALALGAISCLTLPPPGASRRLVHRIIRIQAMRLNRFLYLSAALLVVGLIFLSAFLRWPAFVHARPESFLAHADALIFYFGISYSILLASYYAPVALLLSRAARRSGIPEAKTLLSDARTGPLKAAKVAAAIFAPTLASLLTGFLDFG